MEFNGQTQNAFQPNGAWTTPLTIRLLVPACQCGCLIGKGGAKIKELRNVRVDPAQTNRHQRLKVAQEFYFCLQMTGASVQVASEALPNSTERTITLTGNFEPITRCFEIVCQMLSEVCPVRSLAPSVTLYFSDYLLVSSERTNHSVPSKKCISQRLPRCQRLSNGQSGNLCRIGAGTTNCPHFRWTADSFHPAEPVSTFGSGSGQSE